MKTGTGFLELLDELTSKSFMEWVSENLRINNQTIVQTKPIKYVCMPNVTHNS